MKRERKDKLRRPICPRQPLAYHYNAQRKALTTRQQQDLRNYLHQLQVYQKNYLLYQQYKVEVAEKKKIAAEKRAASKIKKERQSYTRLTKSIAEARGTK